MKVTVRNCARCGEDHEMEFNPFSQNGIDDFTHWGMCPSINEPVLLKFIDSAKVPADQPAPFAVDEARINELEMWRGNRPV